MDEVGKLYRNEKGDLLPGGPGDIRMTTGALDNMATLSLGALASQTAYDFRLHKGRDLVSVVVLGVDEVKLIIDALGAYQLPPASPGAISDQTKRLDDLVLCLGLHIDGADEQWDAMHADDKPDPANEPPAHPDPDPANIPAYLQDDAPFRVCDRCGRKSWAPQVRPGDRCGAVLRPDGNNCVGHFGSLVAP